MADTRVSCLHTLKNTQKDASMITSTSRTPIIWASVFAGPAFETFGEDGPEVRSYFFVEVSTSSTYLTPTPAGTLVYREGFENRYEADRLASRVECLGTINPEFWVDASPWDYVREEVAEANRLAAMGASEADLEALGLA
jgi:hypothetical protein